MLTLKIEKGLEIKLLHIFNYVFLFGSILFLGRYLQDIVGILSFILFFWLLFLVKNKS